MSQFMFETDFSEHPHLPSPMQLQYKILIKNKKLIAEPMPYLPSAQDTNRMKVQNKGILIVAVFIIRIHGSKHQHYLLLFRTFACVRGAKLVVKCS